MECSMVEEQGCRGGIRSAGRGGGCSVEGNFGHIHACLSTCLCNCLGGYTGMWSMYDLPVLLTYQMYVIYT